MLPTAAPGSFVSLKSWGQAGTQRHGVGLLIQELLQEHVLKLLVLRPIRHIHLHHAIRPSRGLGYKPIGPTSRYDLPRVSLSLFFLLKNLLSHPLSLLLWSGAASQKNKQQRGHRVFHSHGVLLFCQ